MEKKIKLLTFLFLVGLIVGGYYYRNRSIESLSKYVSRPDVKRVPAKVDSNEEKREEVKTHTSEKVQSDIRPVMKQQVPKVVNNTHQFATSIDNSKVQITNEAPIKILNSNYNIVKNLKAIRKEDYVEGKFKDVATLNSYYIVDVSEGETVSDALVVLKDQTNSTLAIFTGILKVKFYEFDYAYNMKWLIFNRSGKEINLKMVNQLDYINIAYYQFDSFEDTMLAYKILQADEFDDIISRVTIDVIQWRRDQN